MQKLITPLREIVPFAGLFYYSGFGYGYLYISPENREWMDRTEALKKCHELGLKYEFVDSLEGYQSVYLGD